MGYLDRETELLECYCAADVFAFASLTETQGLVLLEAMAVGLPVVALAAMGTRDILAQGRGALVASASEQDFAEKLVRVLGDAALRAALSQQAFECAAAWDAVEVAERLRGFYVVTLAAGKAHCSIADTALEGS